MNLLQDIAKAIAAGVDAFRAERDARRAELRRQAEERARQLEEALPPSVRRKETRKP